MHTMRGRRPGLRRRAVTARDAALERSAHDARTASILGIALGVAFTLCAATGLISHLIQDPPSWFRWPARPAGLYRVTQGVHVATGTAAIPLLLAKLWSVWPRLFKALARDPVELLHRVTLVPLVGGALFMLFSGYANVARWYPWEFFFPRAHFWMAWLTVGALVVHVGARAHVARDQLRRRTTGTAGDPPAPPAPVERASVGPAPVAREDSPPRIGRRALLSWAFGTSAGITLVTAGQSFPALGRFVLLAPRDPDRDALQGLPVNQTASEAGVTDAARDPGWRLVVEADGREVLSLDHAALVSMAQRSAELPIACVEGWSRSAHWRGVPMRDVLERAGVGRDRTVVAESLERNGLYGSSTVEPQVWRDRDTLLALELNGAPLDVDHGFPVRLIAPNRPGVMQTKWLSRLVVR
jgi:hypothetical protein